MSLYLDKKLLRHIISDRLTKKQVMSKLDTFISREKEMAINYKNLFLDAYKLKRAH